MPCRDNYSTFNLLKTNPTEIHSFNSLITSSSFVNARGDGLLLPFSQRLTVRTLTPNFRANPSWLKPSLRLSSLIASLSISEIPSALGLMIVHMLPTVKARSCLMSGKLSYKNAFADWSPLYLNRLPKTPPCTQVGALFRTFVKGPT